MLCLKLWGEIWNIPDEIDFNSDNSQGQHGVDIYGPVEGGLKYNGVQCKNKKLNLIDGSPNRITIADIDAEIEKAKEFKPALNKLVIATSLPKDQKVEEHVRLKSVENLEAGLFSIQICFWEFFERKLPEYQRIFDWYLKNENFQRVASASVVFSSDGSTEKVHRPKFQKTIHQYVLKSEDDPITIEEATQLMLNGSMGISQFMALQNKRTLNINRNLLIGNETYKWHQNFWFKLRIENTGQSVLEDFKLEISADGEFEEIGAESRSGLMAQHFSTDVRGYSNTKRSVYVKPTERIVVQGDSYTTDSIYLKPFIGQKTEITLYWKILGRDFEDSGKLTVKIDPLYYEVVEKHLVDRIEDEKQETSFSLIFRPGYRHPLSGSVTFSDKESNYTFTED